MNSFNKLLRKIKFNKRNLKTNTSLKKNLWKRINL